VSFPVEEIVVAKTNSPFTEASIEEVIVEYDEESESDTAREVLPRSMAATTMMSFDFTGDAKVALVVHEESVLHADPETWFCTKLEAAAA
jgi:hypothetical protein